jgi:hypothetical protein
MQQFSLFNSELTIQQDLINFNNFRHKYIKLADDAKYSFTLEYNKLSSMEQLFEKVPNIYYEKLTSIINKAVEDLVHNKVYDIDEERFADRLAKKVQIAEVLSKLSDKYEEILEDQAEKDAYRTERRQNRGRFYGSGYGMSGAIKASINAGVLNAGTGLLHGAANVVGSAFSAIGAAAKKKALFSESTTFTSIINAAHHDFHLILFTLTDILQHNGIQIYQVTDRHIDDANVIFKSVTRSSFPKEEIIDTMIKAISLNPYNEKYYNFIIDTFGDENKEVENVASFFNVDVENYKQSLIKEFYKKQDVVTFDRAIIAKDNTINFSKSVGYSLDSLIADINALIEGKKYEKVYSEYATYPKGTIDDWHKCREEIEILCKKLEVSDSGEKILAQIANEFVDFKIGLAKSLMTTLPLDTEDDVIASKKKLEDYCEEIVLPIDNPVIHEINDILAKMDQNIRTVEGFEFETREKAQKANDDKNAIEALWAGQRHVCKSDYLTFLSFLENNSSRITPEIALVYKKKCNEGLGKIDSLSNKAKEYEYRKNFSHHLYNGNKKQTIIAGIGYLVLLYWALPSIGAFIFIIGVIIGIEAFIRSNEKKAWNELTLSGQFKLETIFSTQLIENSPLANLLLENSLETAPSDSSDNTQQLLENSLETAPSDSSDNTQQLLENSLETETSDSSENTSQLLENSLETESSDISENTKSIQLTKTDA